MPRRKFNLDYPRLGAFAWIRADRPGKAKRNKGRLRRQRCRALSIKGFASPPKQQARCDATATRHCRNRRRRILCLRQNRLLLLARPRAPSAGDNDVRGVRHRSRHGADIDSIDIMYLPHSTNRTRRPSPSGYVSPDGGTTDGASHHIDERDAAYPPCQPHAAHRSGEVIESGCCCCGA